MNYTAEQLDALLCDMYGEGSILLADGFHQAFMGVTYDMSASEMKAIYSYSKCIVILIEQGMTEEEALEYFDYNICGSYVGPKTPIWMHEIIFD